MKLSDAQRKAVEAARSNPDGLIAFDRRNERGMDALVEAGLAEEGFAYRPESQRARMFAELRETIEVLMQHRTEPNLETVELDAMKVQQIARDLQRKRHYLTEKGRYFYQGAK